MHGGFKAPGSECSTPCTGNSTELCGGGDRIQIYKDSTWTDPTFVQLADAIEQYNASLAEGRAIISDYRNNIDTLQTLLGQSGKKSRRQSVTVTEIEMRVLGNRGTMRNVQALVGKLYYDNSDLEELLFTMS
jgi:hypothetical protein